MPSTGGILGYLRVEQILAESLLLSSSRHSDSNSLGNCAQVSQQLRIALAGYRLAEVLNCSPSDLLVDLGP